MIITHKLTQIHACMHVPPACMQNSINGINIPVAPDNFFVTSICTVRNRRYKPPPIQVQDLGQPCICMQMKQ